MNKDEAINIASKLLKNVYNTTDPSNIHLLASILNAEANKNVDWLFSALDEIIKFCDKLKKAMYNQE